jgi:hypothetical protein
MGIMSIVEKFLPEKTKKINLRSKTVSNRTGYPKDWHWFRLTSYSWSHLQELEEWCIDAPWHGDFRLVGVHTSCPYEVGILIENANDAMLYKLTWDVRDNKRDDPESDEYEGPHLDY